MSNPNAARTGGSDARAGRDVGVPFAHFDLAHELARLSAEPAGNDAGRQSITLGRAGGLRLVLTAVRVGATLGGTDTDGSLAIQVIRGAATVARDAEQATLEPGQVAIVAEGAPWRAVAESDSVLLLTLSWPTEIGADDGASGGR